MSGNLSFRPINAKLTHDTDTFSRMDPYVKATLGNQIQKSSVAKDAGKHPSWGDQLSFRRSTEDLLTIEVWDRDVGKDDLVGSVTVAFATIQQKTKYSDWLQLSYKGKSAGQILCEFAWIPDSGSLGGGFGGQTFGVPMQGMVQQTYTQPMYVQPTFTQPQTQPFVQTTYVQQQPQYIPQQQFIPQQQPQYIPQQQPQYIPQQQSYPQQQQFIPQQQSYPQQQQQQFIPQQQGYPQQQSYPQQQGGYPQQQGGYPQQGGYYHH